MIFTEKRNLFIHKDWRKGWKNPKADDMQLREKQYARLADMNKQRLLGYAESFRELAESFQEEFTSDAAIIFGADRKNRQSLLEERMLWENRQLIGSNLCEVAEIMTQVASKELCYEAMEERKQRLLMSALGAEGIVAEGMCYLPLENGKKALGMTLRTEKGRTVSSDEVGDMLSVLLKTKLEPSVTSPYMVDMEKRSFLFVEEAKYITFTGLAKAVKETESISGDNFAILQSETGKMTVLLSDGTGSGPQACADSGRVLDLMEKMLETEFGMETAINMVNTALFSKGEESNHPTLDICNLDLYQGGCNIWKIGGAVTLLKRNEIVDKIGQETFPLGIFQNIKIPMQHCQLREGDYLFFMTDGVLDALAENASEDTDCETLVAEMVSAMPERNPQDMAEKLLQQVLKNSNGHIQDDMTILVVGIWENS